MAINILIADDHSLIRAGLRALLQGVSDLNVVGEAENGYNALSRIAELKPDIVLMDISLPGLSGIEVTRQVRGISPGTRVLILTVHEDEGMLRESIRAGAHGYILKQAADAELIQAVRVVSQGHMYIYPTLTSALVKDLSPHKASPQPAIEVLTAREKDVLLMLARGYTNRQIATEMNLSVRTIEGHRASVVDKLGISSRVELMNYVEEHGLGNKGEGRGGLEGRTSNHKGH
jgi:two-component system response regulator NreC